MPNHCENCGPALEFVVRRLCCRLTRSQRRRRLRYQVAVAVGSGLNKVTKSKLIIGLDFALAKPGRPVRKYMIDVNTAVQLIRDASRPLSVETISLSDSPGRVLAQPVVADIDAPPFDKSMMDGFAIQSADVTSGRLVLKVVDRVMAGQKCFTEVQRGTAIEIMTGAAIPNGADAIVIQEETSPGSSPEHVTIRAEKIRAGQNILPQGSVYHRSDTLVLAGHRISAQDVGLLAEAGANQLQVRRRPVLGVIATGNEICPPDQFPNESQIRNSNGPLLLSLAQAHGASAVDLGSAADDEQALSQTIQRGLATDVLVLTGGVSAGMLDFVPRVLKSLGVQQIFHKVSLKPGKPVWFGLHNADSHRCLVFGLPGNPVSTYVCFHLLVREALLVLGGKAASANDSSERGILAKTHEIRGDRPTYWPSRLSIIDGKALVEPLDWRGSADQRCLVQANCLAVFPEGNLPYAAGALIEIRRLI